MILQTDPVVAKEPVVEFAWQELTRHLAKLSAAFPNDYPVRLELLHSSPADTYVYCFAPEGGRIGGSTPGSILLGVYAYLRQLGFVFLLPGEGGTYVPAISDPAALCCAAAPSGGFLHRGVCVEGADSLENMLAFIDWLPKNGFNSFFVQFKKPDVFFERWYHHIFNPTLPGRELTRGQLDEMDARVAEAMALRGIRSHRVGHGWTAEALGFPGTGWHSYTAELSEDTRPLAAQLGGKRALFRGIPANTNLCYSNPRARERLIRQVVDYARENPGTDYLHFWLADECNNVCECDACKNSLLADQYISILNALDQRLTAEQLNIKIVFLLYQELLYAPLKEKIENPDRFVLMFAPISRTFERSYPAGVEDVSIAPYVRNHFRLPETVEENIAHYLRWKAVFSGECFFYDYPLGRAHYGDFGYMKIARVIYDDIRTLAALGSDGYMSCQELRAMCPTGFPNYVMGQTLLNPDISYETLRSTYFSAMFGENWEAAAMFLEQLSQFSNTDYFNGHGQRKQPELEMNFRQIAQSAMAFLMDIPELKAEAFRENWEFMEFHCRYAILLASALAELCCGHTDEAQQYFREFCGFIRDNELRWQSRLDVYRVIEVATKYTGFTDPDEQEDRACTEPE